MGRNIMSKIMMGRNIMSNIMMEGNKRMGNDEMRMKENTLNPNHKL